MSLLDEARRLKDVDPAALTDWCPFCDGHSHTKICPWLSMPRIVAVLEAVSRLIESNALIVEGEGTWKLHCLSCEAVQDDWTPFAPKPFLHTPECLIAALEVAVVPQESENAPT